MKTFFCLVALLLLGAWTPADLLQDLQVKYDHYYEKYPSVKLNLLFNQPTYSPGDTAFFSGWYMNEAFMAVKGEHIVTLDLLSGNGSTAQRTRFKVRNGKGNSQIVFRNELTPGTYTLVAYTDWMKNFGDAWFYQKSIPIVSKNQFSTKKKQDEHITFYPEGGNLIEGMATKVVVTGPPAIELIVHDGQQSEVTKVQLDSTGLGSFVITPQANQKYAADWPAPGKGWPLPDSKKDGISVRAGQKDLLEIQLSIPTHSAWAGKEIYTIVIAAGKISFKQRITLKENEPLLLPIPKFEKSDVLHQLYVFGADGKISFPAHAEWVGIDN